MASLSLPPDLRAELFVYAREAHPEEACGFLIGTQDSALITHNFAIAAVRPARNLHPSRDDRFTIDPLDYAKAEAYCARHKKKALRILGFWHSHPKSAPEPSPVDLEWAQGLFMSFPERYLYLILSLRDPDKDELACWQLDERGESFQAVDVR